MPLRALVVVVTFLLRCVAQDASGTAESRSAEPAARWDGWVEGLRSKESGQPFTAGAWEGEAARFAANAMKSVRLVGCVKDKRTQSLLQSVMFTEAGIDPAETFIEAVGASPPIRFTIDHDLAVRGVDSLDVRGDGEMFGGDASKDKLDLPSEADLEKLQKRLKRSLFAGLSDEPIRVARPEFKGRVVLVVPRNNDDAPAALPKFAAALKNKGARAIVIVEDRGVDAIQHVIRVVRRDRQQKPTTEEPPAIFMRKEAALTLAGVTGLPLEFLYQSDKDFKIALIKGNHDIRVKVTTRSRNVDMPNVVAMIEGRDPTSAIVISAPFGETGHAGAVLLAAASELSPAPEPPQRSIIFVMHARPDLRESGQAWFLGHAPAPVSKILAGVSIEDNVAALPEDARQKRLIANGRFTAHLRATVATLATGEALAAGITKHRSGEVYAKAGVPAVGVVAETATAEAGIVAARLVADLARALANRPASQPAAR